MNFLLSLLLDQLDLTKDERDAIAVALPNCKVAVDALDSSLPDIYSANHLYIGNQTLLQRLFSDVKKLGPNVSALLGDGWVDIPTTMSAAKDVEAAIQGDPATVNTVQALVGKLMPLFNTLQREWPNIKPAYDALSAALGRKGLSLTQFVSRFNLGG